MWRSCRRFSRRYYALSNRVNEWGSADKAVDSPLGPGVQARRRLSLARPAPDTVTDHRRLTVQIVRGDGTRVAGLPLSLRLVACALVALGLTAWGASRLVTAFDSLSR